MSFPRYERFKDSGVEWLEEVPEHWLISRLGFESWVEAMNAPTLVRGLWRVCW